MGYWQKHSKPDLEDLLTAFHEAGWEIIDPRRKYYKVRCPCGAHQRTVHLSPSNPRYAKDSLAFLKRQTCYPEGGKQQ